MSQENLALLLQVSRSQIAMFETGKRNLPLQAMEKLALNPHIGHKRDDLTDKPVRFWNVHSYTVIYNPDASPLMVLRIISNYRDIEALLND